LHSLHKNNIVWAFQFAHTQQLSAAPQPLESIELSLTSKLYAAMAAAQLLQDIDGVRNCFRAEEVQ